MTEDQHGKHELAKQVAVAVAAGAVGLRGPQATAIATGLSPLALAGLERITEVIRERRLQHAAETLTDAADEFGARTAGEFSRFVEFAVRDAAHQELLARALLIAQDTAMRDKRRALGRALAAAAADAGTKVDSELVFVRVLADLDEPHIRLLRLLATSPEQPEGTSDDVPASWYPSAIRVAEPGFAETLWALLNPLERNGLAWVTSETYRTAAGTREPQCAILPSGRDLLARLSEPESQAIAAAPTDHDGAAKRPG